MCVSARGRGRESLRRGWGGGRGGGGDLNIVAGGTRLQAFRLHQSRRLIVFGIPELLFHLNFGFTTKYYHLFKK